MKVTCEHCGSNYRLPDDKVAGKRIKLRCKKCHEQIVVVGPHRRDKDQIGSVTDGPDIPLNEATTEQDQAPLPLPQSEAKIWRVGTAEGEQHGPYSENELGKLLSTNPNELQFVWRSGFEEWRKPEEVDELSHLFQAPPIKVPHFQEERKPSKPSLKRPTRNNKKGLNLSTNILIFVIIVTLVIIGNFLKIDDDSSSSDTDPPVTSKVKERLTPPQSIRPVMRTVYATVQTANVRSQPTTNSSKKGTVKYQDVLQVVGEKDDWLEIKCNDGSTGWIAGRLVSKEKPKDIQITPTQRSERTITPTGPADYFPLAVGNWWKTDDGQKNTITKTINEKGITKFIIENSILGESKYYRQNNQIISDFDNGQYTVFLKNPINIGDSWSEEQTWYSNAGAAYTSYHKRKYTIVCVNKVIDVPAGVFTQCIGVEFEGMARSASGELIFSSRRIDYFAPNVGLVKAEFDGGPRLLIDYKIDKNSLMPMEVVSESD